MPMTKPTRELTTQERRSIRKLVTGCCANYDRDYGCLPLDCECPMLGVCYTNSAMCRYFREALLPNDGDRYLLKIHRQVRYPHARAAPGGAGGDGASAEKESCQSGEILPEKGTAEAAGTAGRTNSITAPRGGLQKLQTALIPYFENWTRQETNETVNLHFAYPVNKCILMPPFWT